MAMGKRRIEQQAEFWIPTEQIATGPGHPFYRKLNEVLVAEGFDAFAEDCCRRFYKTGGRPSIPPGVYFRMLLIGFFEGIDSERGIAWRCADSLGLREFLGYSLQQSTPDHSTLSVIRNRIDLEAHREVFGWVLSLLARHELVRGKTVGIDATTLEANAAMRSIVRRDTGESYEQFLTGLAQASGIATPTRQDLAKIDRKRKKKASNQDWYNPHDPDAKVAKMKDGRTHLAHKAEHAVDLQTGAIVGVTVQPADMGDTSTVEATFDSTLEHLLDLQLDPTTEKHVHSVAAEEVVADKGYHSQDCLESFEAMAVRTYISEPDRKRGPKANSPAVRANRRRVQGNRGRRLLRKRGELLERPFAHCYETGGMRRTHLRGHVKILKRLLVHVAGCNLALLMRKVFGIGTPRGLQGLAARVLAVCRTVERFVAGLWRAVIWAYVKIGRKIAPAHAA